MTIFNMKREARLCLINIRGRSEHSTYTELIGEDFMLPVMVL